MADARHKRDTDARRFAQKPRFALGARPSRTVLVAAPVAVLATAAAVTVGLAATATPHTDVVAAADLGRAVTKPVPHAATVIEDRGTSLSRSLSRTEAVEARTGDKQWTTTALDLWTKPGKKGEHVGELKTAVKVLATGREASGRAEIVVDGKVRWVTTGYLADEKPAPEPPPGPAGLSAAPCPDSGPENGLTDAAVMVYRSVCHAFPEITSYGGWDAHGEHSSGKALDIMTSDSGLGDAIAEYLQAHSSELGLYDILWQQRIWTPVRAAEGWRSMEDRGSATANHYDHVHVSVN